MKTLKFQSKLNLNKKTIAKLQGKEMHAVKGGRIINVIGISDDPSRDTTC